MTTRDFESKKIRIAYLLPGLIGSSRKRRSSIDQSSPTRISAVRKVFRRIKEFGFVRRSICSLVITSILAVSTPAAPQTIVGMAGKTWQDARFAFLSSRIAIDSPNWFAGLFVGAQNTNRPATISRIQIFPGPVTLQLGRETVFSAVAYDSDDQPLSGVAFEWTSADTRRGLAARRFSNSEFKARSTGRFTIKASAGNREAEISVIVTPIRNARPPNQPVYRTSSRSGRQQQRIVEKDESDTSTGQKETVGEMDTDSKETTTQAELLLGEGWDNTNWLSADDPGNQTGNPPGMPADDGAGSGNFQLSAPVASLPGRGIDLALNLNYNSRLWNKSGSQVTYDIDRGFPAPGWSLGFGKIAFMGPQGGCMMVDADGTRRGYTGQVSSWSTGATFTGHTTDGSFIDYRCDIGYGLVGEGWAKLPNGTKINYESINPASNDLHPTRIADAQGNYVTITYRSNQGPPSKP